MNYTEEKIIEMAGTDIVEHGSWVKDLEFKEDDFICADTFYQSKTAARIGKTADTERDYNEVIGEFLLENKFIQEDKFTGIMQITRKEPYYTNKEFSAETSEAVKIFEKYSLSGKLGSIIDVSVPLSNYENDMAGTIDLLTYKKDTNELFIVQIKPHSSNETLLSALLEIQTRYQTVNKEKLVEDFYSIEKIPVNNPKIRKALVIQDGSTAYEEEKCYGYIAKIIEDLQIEVLPIEW